MKPLIQILAVLSAAAATGQEPDPPSAGADWRIYVEVKVFAGSSKKLNPMVSELRDESKVNDAAAKLEKMVESGEAELVGTIAAQTIENRRINAFQGEEVRYPIEFEYPQVIDGKPAPPVNPAALRDITYLATAYDTRHVGLSLGVEASVSTDGKRFVVDVGFKRTWFLQWDEFENGRLANNDKILVKQPRFASADASSTFAMSNHERILLGIHPVPGSPDKMEVALLRIWSTPRKTP